MDGEKPKIRRRHRADTSGFRIVFTTAENLPPPQTIYRALADEFWKWRQRVAEAKARGEDVDD